ncbi:cellulose binding domain-containing protein [Microbispora bryophytorum]|uniref:glucuronyl esterase domain-containing protein n=1 Tax=Microbispora bryophytorum TaxID=1460882 RepID=UPI0033C7FB19
MIGDVTPGGGSRTPGVRRALVIGAVAALSLGLAVVEIPGGNAGVGALAPWTAQAAAAAAGVEDEGADCAVSDLGSLTANSRLPDPFKKINGQRITSKSEWRCRREEIKKLAERYVYGDKHGKPAGVTGTVSRTGITVNVSDSGRSASFSASVDLPSGTGPFPAVIVYGGFGADTATIKASGAAVISYDPFTVGKEGTARNNKQGAYYSIYGSSSSTGLLAAWAWGVSRIIDVIEQSGGGILKADATGVTGCSRFGKGAFTAGVFDQRIALTMPIESGSAGVPILRGVAQESGAQPLSSAYSEQPWLGDAFGSFTGNPAQLPVDTHEMVGMIAPRGLFIMENPHVDWLGAQSGSVAALAGAEIYKALGAGDNISYWSDVQDGTHCATRSEWRTPLQQNIQKFLLKTGNASAVFRVSSRKSGNLSQWRDWTTPVLTDSSPSPSPSPSSSPRPPVSPSPSPSGSPDTSPSPPVSPSPSPSGGVSGACSATVRVINSWSGGWQGEVTVRAGNSAVNGWTVDWTWPGSQTITQIWGGVRSGSGSNVTVRNESWNGSVAANGSTTFGFLAGGSSATPAATCTSP